MRPQLTVEERIKSALGFDNSVMRLREDGPLIDPYTCEIINECNLDTTSLATYARHLSYMKSYFNKKSSFLKLYLNSINIFGDIFETSITIAACIEYVAATYLENDNKSLFSIFDVLIATIFLVDWIVHLVLSERRLEFIVSFSSIIDYLTVIPVYLEIFGNSFGIKVSFFRVLRVLRSVRILRLFKALDVISEQDDDTNRLKYTVDTSGISKQIVITSITLLSVLFISAGVVNSINDLVDGAYYYPLGTEFDFLAAFYYMIVTSSTLGYGDIYPLVTLSRMATVVIISFMIFIITNQLSKISQLMQNYSKYDTQYYFKNHIVIVGNYRPKNLAQFLAQFYHSDHGDVKTESIIVGLEYPNSEMIGILTNPMYEGRVYYLEGNPSYSTTWRNANIELAESVFILTDQLNENLKSQDTYAILLAKMIQAQCPLIKSHIQLIRPIEYNLNSDSTTCNTVISLQAIKMSLLGTSVHNKGFSTLMSGLYLAFGTITLDESADDWFKLFTHGLSQEIYCVMISDYFIDKPFYQGVDIIYHNCNGILTLGVKSLIGLSSRQEILINPINYCFKKNDFVFVVASDQESADLIMNYSGNSDYQSVSVSNFAQVALSHNFQTVKMLAKEYHCELKAKSILDLVEEDLNGKISNHVLVFGGLEGFEILIKGIRVYSEQPICLVNENSPGIQWDKFTRYKNIFFFKGNTMSFQDIYNSAIKDCYSVLILSKTSVDTSAPDSEAVLLTKLIEYSFPETRIIVELIDRSFIRFMGSKPKSHLSKRSYNFWPNAVSGKVYFSSYLDSFICQTYYNKDLLDIIMRIMGITKSSNQTENLNENSIIRTIKVPKFYFEGRDDPLLYSEIFKDLLHLSAPVIALGILSRSFKINSDDTEEESEQTVVLTNPPPGTVVGIRDKIICLGEPNDDLLPGESEDGEGSKAEENKGSSSEFMFRNRRESLNSKEDEEDAQQNDAIKYLFHVLKKRLETTGKLAEVIETNNKMISDLQNAADKLKEQLLSKHDS